MNRQIFSATIAVAITVSSTVGAFAAGPEFPGKGNKKDWQKASKTYDQALSQRKRGNIDAAIKLYEEAIAIYPYDADFYYNLSIHYARDKKNAAKGEGLIKKAIELKPDKYDFQWEYAAQLLAQGRLAEGKDVLTKAESLKKTSAQAAELKDTLKKIDDANKS